MSFLRISAHRSRNASAPAAPLETLLGCHARIRHIIQLSRTLAGAEEVPRREIAEAATSIARFFRRALPLHEADESDSLFPCLRTALPQGGLVWEAAETMIEQHKAINELAAELLPLCASLGRQPSLLLSLSRPLDHVTGALGQIFAAHLYLEETVVFPAVADLLSPAQIREISRQMHQRRQPPSGTIHLVQ
jgi:hypothetical protein